MMVQWVLSGSLPIGFLVGYLCVVAAALVVDWRPRLLVAVGTAVLILFAGRSHRWRRWPDSRVIGYLARISFSLFLSHFPACLVVNAWLSRWSLTPGQALAGMVAAWGVSVLMAILVHHLVELPVLRRTAKPKPAVTNIG
jgi:peptidoglycan/LPS O-acetylase OafA/YrhL